MEATKKRIMPKDMLAWLMRSQERKRELHQQFQKDCQSGKVDEIIRNGKPVNR